ncbi:MAG: hypothetical protein ACRYFZ_11995 [Janthinobacterium lividum]
MAYQLKYADGSAQVLSGRVAITRQDNDITKPDTVQASFSTTIALPSDVATHKRLAQPQLGTSLSSAPYQGKPCALEAGGVEVLPGAQLRLDDYTPRTGYTGKLLAGNKSFYDLLVGADGDKMLRDLDLSVFDHDWSLAAVALGATHTSWQQGYVYDLYDRGLGAPPVPTAGSSKLYQAGYWPTAYARAVWEAIFVGAGVKWSGELPAVFDTALLPATLPFGYSEQTRADHELVAGYAPTFQRQRFYDEQDARLAVTWVQPYKRAVSGGPFNQTLAVDYSDLHQGAAVTFDPATNSYTVNLLGFYDLKAEQDVAIYCNTVLSGEVSATLEVRVNGSLVGNDDHIRGAGNQDTTLTALAERQLLKPGDVIAGHYKFDKWKGTGGVGPFDESWDLLPAGRLTVQLLADFPPRGRVHLQDWLPDMSQKDFVKGFIQAYGLTQTTDPYTGAVTFRRTAAVLDGLPTGGADWSELRDGSQPAKRSWKLGDFAQRNWFRWKADESNVNYQQAIFLQTHLGQPWNADAAKAAALAFAAGYLDNGAGDTSLDVSKDVLTLPFGATVAGAEGLLLVPYWKPKQGTNYADDLAVIQAALDDDTYSAEEAAFARNKAMGDDFETQEPEPRLVYQSGSVRDVLLEDDLDAQLLVSMRLSYFVDRSQVEDLDFNRSLLPRYYPHLAAALVRPLVLRPYVYLSAADVVAFDQLVPVWLADEQAWFFVNKVDSWEESQPSTAVELIRLL